MIDVSWRPIAGVYYYYDKVLREVYKVPKVDKGLMFKVGSEVLLERQPWMNLLNMITEFDETLRAYQVKFSGYTRRVKSFKGLFTSIATAITSCWKDGVQVSRIGYNPLTDSIDWAKKERLQNAARFEIDYKGGLNGSVNVWIDHRGAYYIWVGARPHKGHFVPRCRAVELGCIPFFDKRTGMHPGINPNEIGVRPYVENNIYDYINRHIYAWLKANLGPYIAGLIVGTIDDIGKVAHPMTVAAFQTIPKYAISLSELERELAGTPVQKNVRELREKLSEYGLDFILHEQLLGRIRRYLEDLKIDIHEAKDDALKKAINAALSSEPDRVKEVVGIILTQTKPLLHAIEELYAQLDPFIDARQEVKEMMQYSNIGQLKIYERLVRRNYPEYVIKVALRDDLSEIRKMEEGLKLENVQEEFFAGSSFVERGATGSYRVADQIESRMSKKRIRRERFKNLSEVVKSLDISDYVGGAENIQWKVSRGLEQEKRHVHLAPRRRIPGMVLGYRKPKIE